MPTLWHCTICIHQSLDITPAMAAGVTQHLYNLGWIVEQVARQRPKPKRPTTYRKTE